MLNLKATKKTPSITVGVNPVTNIHVQEAHQTRVTYPSPAEVEAIGTVESENFDDSEYKEHIDELERENQVLKLIINILHSNPLVVNRYIIADDEALTRIIGLLCKASDVQLDAEDVGEGCISKNKYRKVHSIYVTVDGKTLNLKYDFPAVMKSLKDCRISTKYVF